VSYFGHLDEHLQFIHFIEEIDVALGPISQTLLKALKQLSMDLFHKIKFGRSLQ